MFRKISYNGREYYPYEISNEMLLKILRDNDISNEDKEYITSNIIERFEYDLCPKSGETKDDVFARFFSNFVNGKMSSAKRVAEHLCREHRYLQNEMFKVCLEYIKLLAENYEKGCYDGRNKYAAQTSSKIIENLIRINHPY